MPTLNDVHRLQREVNHRVRYYSLKIYKNLFGEYILESEYGSIKNKRPTGVQRDYFVTIHETLVSRALKIEAKIKKGYKYV